MPQIQHRLIRACLALAPLLASLFPGSHQTAWTQWTINPLTNTPVATATDAQQEPVIVGDAAGGAIIAWVDYRSGMGKDLYAQRLDMSGIAQWQDNGVVICAEPGIQDAVRMISDGEGGAILTWEDRRSDVEYDIYAQRIGPSGTPLWGAGGVPVCAAAGDQQAPSIISDGSGGAIIAWNDLRAESRSNLYAQRINSSGTPQWTPDGVPVLKADIASAFNPVAMTTDGHHGAILSWGSADIYAQRIDSTGATRWDTTGVVLCDADANQFNSVLISDGNGGAIACWTDYRTAPNAGVYAQRVNGSGVAQWDSNGVAVNDTTDNQIDPVIVTDGTGGAIITWTDRRNGTDLDIYAQRLDPTGTRHWTAAGIPLCVQPGDQYELRMASDSAGGAIVAWTDMRVSSADIYAQRIDGSGNVRWAADGLAVTTESHQQQSAVLTTTASKGTIIAWVDGRSSSDDIYAQNIDPAGAMGLAPELLFPANDDAVNADSVRLSWRRVIPVATKYWLEVGTDSLFTFRSVDSTITDSTHVVRNLAAGQTFWWRVKGFDTGWGPFSQARKFRNTMTGIEEIAGLPETFELSQNFPNPFNPSTIIRYALPQSAVATLEVFNTLGQKVATLVNGFQQRGRYSVAFDASGIASGLYFYRLRAGTEVQTQKMMILK